MQQHDNNALFLNNQVYIYGALNLKHTPPFDDFYLAV